MIHHPYSIYDAEVQLKEVQDSLELSDFASAKSLLDEIIELMEKNSRLVQEQFYAFEMHMKKLEYYRKQIEYEYSLANYKESEYEM